MGATLEDAAEHAAEALALHIEGMRDSGDEVPPPLAPDAPLPDWLADVPGGPVVRVLILVEMPDDRRRSGCREY